MPSHGLDLQMLMCFDALMELHSVTRAADRMHMTQPGMSNVLSKLRHALGDPLLVRTAQGMAPTPRALELARHVHEALRHIDALTESRPFSPETDTLTVSVAASDYTNLGLVPALASRLGRDAPGMSLVFYPLAPALMREALVEGRFDLAIGFFAELPEDFHAATLLTDRMACIAGHGHPRVRGTIGLEQYASERHVVFGAGPHYASTVEAQTDAALQALGLARRVALSLPTILALPGVVAETDLIATYPMQGALAHARHLPIQVLETPFPSFEFRISMVWHARTQRSQAHQWLRETVRSVGTQVFGPPHAAARPTL